MTTPILNVELPTSVMTLHSNFFGMFFFRTRAAQTIMDESHVHIHGAGLHLLWRRKLIKSIVVDAGGQTFSTSWPKVSLTDLHKT